MLNQLMILNPGPKRVTKAWLARFARAFEKAVGRQPDERELQMASAQRKVGASIKQSILLTRPMLGDRPSRRPFEGNPRRMPDYPQDYKIQTLSGDDLSEWFNATERGAVERAQQLLRDYPIFSAVRLVNRHNKLVGPITKNPGAGWHFDEAGEHLEMSRNYPYGSPEARYHLGHYDAHVHSEMESRRKKMNPTGYGRRWLVAVELGEGSLLGASNRAFSKKKEATYFAKKIVKSGAVSAEVKDLKTVRWWKWGRGPRGAIKIVDSFDKRMRATDPRRGRKNPCGTVKRRPKRRKKRAGNPTADEGYMGFHGSFPSHSRTVKVPKGFPKRMWLLGTLHRVILKNGEFLKGGYVAAGSGNSIYLLNVRSNIKGKGGRVAQIEYTPRKPSDKHGATYFHTYKTPPSIRKVARGFYIIRGAKQKLTSRGIIG